VHLVDHKVSHYQSECCVGSIECSTE